MFSYIDPTIFDLLVERGLLRHLDDQGEPLSCTQPAGRYLSILGPVPLPIRVGDRDAVPFRWYAFVRNAELGLIKEMADRVRNDQTHDLVPLLSTFMQVSSILVHGTFEEAEAPLVRVHSCCMTSDVFGSRRCECGPQLHEALHRVVEDGAGAVIYMSSHEGRGIGLWAKAVTYLLQDMGKDTYQANTALGLPEDSRDFTDAAIVLNALRPDRPQIRLMSNNPLKAADLQRGGIEIAETIPLVVGFGQHNVNYMRAKKAKGHKIPDNALPKKP